MSERTGSLSRFTLHNGLRVVLAPEPGTGVCAVGVHYGAGFRADPPGRAGLAHLLEHLMFRRRTGPGGTTGGVPAGGYANAATRADSTDFHQVVPAALLPDALAAERDRMAGPRPTAADLAAELDVVAEEIRRNVTGRPYGGFPKVPLPPLLYGDYANTHDGYGDPDVLRRVGPEECRDFFDRHHAPGNAVLTVVGDVSPEAARGLVERRFGDLPARPFTPAPVRDEPAPDSDRYGRYTDPLAPLPAVSVGYRLPDPAVDLPGYLTHVLLAALLEHRLRARLVTRERAAVAVTADCGLVGGPFAARHPVTFACTVTHPETTRAETAVDALDTELHALASEGPGPGELRLVARRWISGLLRGHDAPHARVRSLGAFELLHGDASLHHRIPALLAATPPTDTAAAARHLRDTHRAILTLTPARRVIPHPIRTEARV
ncbi:pitrilysin family protein [Streptomyces sp. NPDC047028]|uniref:M16 family metallopeptidase n=1 Tax=Streptomyces sp. NPDC047028 TaxID=3155793 RepID=UPI0033EA31E9